MLQLLLELFLFSYIYIFTKKVHEKRAFGVEKGIVTDEKCDITQKKYVTQTNLREKSILTDELHLPDGISRFSTITQYPSRR